MTPVTFELGGKSFQLPPELPAAIPLTALRLRKRLGDEAVVPENEILAMAESLFGDEQLSEILRSEIEVDGMRMPVTIEELSDIVEWVFAAYSEPGDVEESEGNSTPPA